MVKAGNRKTDESQLNMPSAGDKFHEHADDIIIGMEMKFINPRLVQLLEYWDA